ncbi:hypothetical protein MRX96_007067 [Rhipicephalus microplus]
MRASECRKYSSDVTGIREPGVGGVAVSCRAVERVHDVCSDGQEAAKVCAWVASASAARRSQTCEKDV